MMKNIKITFGNRLTGFVLFTLAFLSTTYVAAQPVTVKNIVLVHGAFADGSGFRGVYDILTKKGYNVRIAQLPLSGLADDVDAVKRVLDKLEGSIVLVGHSWAGVVITEMGLDPKVSSLVYIAAFVPDVGENAAQWVQSVKSAPENGISTPDKYGYLFYDKAKYHVGFAADVNKADSDFMEVSQVPILASSFGTPVTKAAWKTKPSYAVVTLQDKNIAPEVQRKMYQRANSVITEIKSSHAVYISHAESIATIIEAASKSGN